MNRRASQAAGVTGGFALLIGVLAGCGDVADSGDSTAIREAEGQIAALYRRVNGDAGAAAASEFVVYATVQSHLAECFADAGVTYVPEPWTGRLDAPDDENDRRYPSDYLSLMRVDASSVKEFALGTSMPLADARAVDSPSPAVDPSQRFGFQDPEVDDSTIGPRCRAAATASPSASSLPPRASELSASLAYLLSDVEAEKDIARQLAAARECIAAAGYPGVTNGNDLWLAMAARFEAVAARYPSRAAAARSAQWASLAAEERKAADVQARCLRPVHAAAVQKAADSLPAFEKANGDALLAVDAEWADRRREAAALAQDPALFAGP